MNLANFKCTHCHACCRQPGYVRLRTNEPDAIAGFLNMDVHEFIDAYTVLTRDRACLSLVEQADGACIFLGAEGCRINPVKPSQCKGFPHKWRFSDFKDICGWAKHQNSPDK
jgi:Fe-S-cluster containining protein